MITPDIRVEVSSGGRAGIELKSKLTLLVCGLRRGNESVRLSFGMLATRCGLFPAMLLKLLVLLDVLCAGALLLLAVPLEFLPPRKLLILALLGSILLDTPEELSPPCSERRILPEVSLRLCTGALAIFSMEREAVVDLCS